MTGEIVIYQNSDGNIKLDVRLEEETVWLTHEQMATLFGKGRSTIAEHVANAFAEGELDQNRTCRKFRQVRKEGARDVEREIDHFNLGAATYTHVHERLDQPARLNTAIERS